MLDIFFFIYKKKSKFTGIFANGHTMMNHDRDKSPSGTPSLEQMTSVALQMLMKSEHGFLLVVRIIRYKSRKVPLFLCT